MLLFTFYVTIPDFIKDYKNDIVFKETQEKTIEIIKREIPQEETIVSNFGGFPWLVLPYYLDGYSLDYYESKTIYDMDINKDTCLILTSELNKEDIEYIRSLNFDIKKIMTNGVIGTSYVYIYEIK